jgi:hypothetical protein
VGDDKLKFAWLRRFSGGNMKSSRNFFQLIAFVLFCGLSASAQTALSDAKEFNKDGLMFNYPSGWSFNDTSNTDAQQMTFGRADSDAQITVFVFRTPVTTSEKVAEAKRVLVDKYVASTTKSFEEAGAHPESLPATTEIGGVKAEGVKIRASLDGVPGAAQIEWAVVGQRLVVLTFLGPDKALAKATPAWDTIRTTIKIAEPTPQPKPSPKATP